MGRKQEPRLEGEKDRKMASNSLVTGLSNCTLPFVCNKSADRGWGWAKELPSKQQNGLNFAPCERACKGEFIRNPAWAESWRLMIPTAAASIRARGWTMRKMESDSKGPGEFFWFALELLPDELWLISIVIGVVFGLVWLIRVIFRMSFNP
jgi:hypothetical protein